MNVSKQELEELTSVVICGVASAQQKADTALFLNSKDQMEIADRRISDVLLKVIDFRDKYGFPALLADRSYREARQQERQKEIKELTERLAANQLDIERLTQNNELIEAKLKQLQKEET